MPRPFALDPVFRTLTTLPGVGPKNAKLFEKLIGGEKIVDLLWHKPVDIIRRKEISSIADLKAGDVATLTITVQKHFPSPRRGMPYRVWCTDENGAINLVFFNANKAWIEGQLPVGEKRIISGRIEFYNGNAQIVHPDFIVKPEDKDTIESVEPVYPLTAGVMNKVLRKAMRSAVELAPDLPEWIDAAHKKKNDWPDWREAVRTLHFLDKGAQEKALERLAYDEFLANQLALALMRLKARKSGGRSWPASKNLRQHVLKALPFDLTNAQKRTLAEIDKDMGEPMRMLRLLQGDVGSGKTVVAVMAMLNVIESGAQAAIMAPTEILARQHGLSVEPWLKAANIPYVILTGRDKGKARDKLLAQIASGEAKVIIGTHALFQKGVEFNDLGLAVIDEQHRFGVHQRLELSSKGKGTDVLVMTATPIPRTLTLTAYGDMEVSRLDEKPPGRKPIDTLLISKDKVDEMIAGIARQIKTGARVYWVCPLVEESEKLDLEAAEDRYDVLKSIFGDKVGLVHGRLKPDEKDAVMADFASGKLQILVATTVIEVGVNVPEATIMIIEQAERFGLAQLHQLRGRVGRGGDKSFCFLLYADKLSENAKERLIMMRDTEDGFLIAEKDLELRGGGEILGTRQSGLPTFRLADLSKHADLLATARDDTKLILNKDPDLAGERGNHLKTLLYLFEQDQAIRSLRAG